MIIRGYKNKICLITKDYIGVPRIEENFAGDEKDCRNYCIRLVLSENSTVEDVFTLTSNENVRLNVVGNAIPSIFTKIVADKSKLARLFGRIGNSGIANSYIPMFRIYENDSSGIKLNMGTVEANEKYIWEWGILDSIKDLVAYMYLLVPKGVLIDSIYLPRDVIANYSSIGLYSLYIRSFHKGLVDCCILREDFKGFVKDRDFILL